MLRRDVGEGVEGVGEGARQVRVLREARGLGEARRAEGLGKAARASASAKVVDAARRRREQGAARAHAKRLLLGALPTPHLRPALEDAGLGLLLAEGPRQRSHRERRRDRDLQPGVSTRRESFLRRGRGGRRLEDDPGVRVEVLAPPAPRLRDDGRYFRRAALGERAALFQTRRERRLQRAPRARRRHAAHQEHARRLVVAHALRARLEADVLVGFALE
mmetsp:Transcript_2964/g.9263  ORF Transcript_2964/g.9263 Transcript_2964/m.9263 type:complete len:219 (+) Transcript_2964:1182-1838(+)